MSHREIHLMQPDVHHGTGLLGIGPLGRLEDTVANALDSSGSVLAAQWEGRNCHADIHIDYSDVSQENHCIALGGHTFVVKIADCSTLVRHHKEIGREASHGRMSWALHVLKSVNSFGHHVSLCTQGASGRHNPLGSRSLLPCSPRYCLRQMRDQTFDRHGLCPFC